MQRPRNAPSTFGGANWYDLDTAKQAHVAIQKLDESKLCTEGDVSILPYPGTGEPPRMPGGSIQYVAGFELELFMDFVESRPHSEIYLSGCKGIGKSCLLRAAVCCYMKTAETHERIVCIWNMKRAFIDLTSAFKDALAFTYCLDNDVVSSLQQIADLEELKAFISQRKEQGDIFVFIVDGAQCLDPQDSSGQERKDSVARVKCKVDLLSVMQLGVRSIYALSLEAADALEARRKEQMNYFELRTGFTEETFRTYVANSALSCVLDGSASRKEDVYYLAGGHPMSIARLSKCITDYVRKFELDEIPQTKKRRTLVPPSKEPRLTVSQCFRDEGHWRAVKQEYIHDVMRMKPAILKIIRSHLAQESTIRQYFSVEEMMAVDPRYVLAVQPPYYCTPLIHTVYAQAFREAQRDRYPQGPWLDYCKYLLQNPRGIVWSSMGWLCQEVVKDFLTSGRGLQFGGRHIRNLQILSFTEVPSSSEWMPLLAHGNKDESGVVCLPNCYKPYDAVVIWRRKVYEGWEYHLWALDFTVNHLSNFNNARDFMDINCIKEWIPDIREKQRNWMLHYTFVTHDDLHMPSRVLASVAYRVDIYSFESVLRHSIDGETARTLGAIVAKVHPRPALAVRDLAFD